MASTQKSLYYKVAEFHGLTTKQSLQSMLSAAIKSKQAAVARCQKCNADGTANRLINYNGSHKGMFVGEMLDYTHGHNQSIAEIDPKKAAFPLKSLAPPNNKSEFIHSILYFAVNADHVIVSQSSSLRSKQFEDYINWLLHETKQLKDEQFVALSDQPVPNASRKIGGTKGLTLSAPVHFKATNEKSPNARNAVDASNVKKVKFKPQGRAWKAFRDFLPPELDIPSELDVDQFVEGKDLVVEIELSWKGSRKGDSSALLDSVANQLRHVDGDLDYTIETRSGAKITKSELKLSKPISVILNKDGEPERSDLWSKMQEWLESLIQEGRVLSQ